VLGVEDEARDPHELGDATASMSINGVDVGHGRGSDILGHPLVALAWLVNNCARLGTPVLAGDIVLLGSVVQTQWVDSGDVVVVHNDMLGDVSASFSTP
jgi:2-oxo-3-hexenedioate decarboxylase/2-keto-4-pentenoate hydratase